MYEINTLEELKQFLIDNNIKSSNNLAKLGIYYWENKLKPLIYPCLFKTPKTKKALEELINNDYPLLLIDTFDVGNFKDLFKNKYNNNLKSKEYWENPMNYLGFWNTNNVKNISKCFYNQKHFNQKIYWNTKNVENSSLLFYNCYDLNQEIKLFLPDCKNIDGMFFNCEKLNSPIILGNLDNVENAKSLFLNCEKLNQKITLDLPKCKKISHMFYLCKKLNSKIILNNLDNIVEFSSLFSHCKKLEFKNIEFVINQLITKLPNIKKFENNSGYKIPEEYKKQLDQKCFFVVYQI